MKKILPFIFSLILLGIISCKEQKAPLSEGTSPNTIQEPGNDPVQQTDVKIDTQQPVEASTDGSIEEQELNGQDTGIQPEEEKKLTGTISFEESTHDFGRLGHGNIASNKFRFTNTGEGPLTIKNVSATCGCTVPKYPSAPIAPGEEGFIEVEFNSKKKMGIQHHSITVFTDGNPPRARLVMKGLVVPPGDEDTSS